MAPIIHWFRRDLRLADNSALAAAAQAAGGALLPVFIFDPTLLRGRWTSPPRTAWLLANLHALAAELEAQGSRLTVRHGPPVAALVELVRSSGARAVYWNRDDSPYARERDRVATSELQALGIEVRSFKDGVIFERDEVLKPTGEPYTVFTPYARRWRERLATEPLPPPKPTPTLAALAEWPAAQPIPTLAELGLPASSVPLPPAGTKAAMMRLHHFATAGLANYATQRDRLALPGTSRLSPDLRFGTLSVRLAMQTALAQLEGEPTTALHTSITRWVNELIWREFYTQILYHFPHVLHGAFRRAYDLLPWAQNVEQFAAWQAGRTGYPVVDAAMCQLQQEGWMHNRARMLVASFLSKDLLLDWRWGERHFMHLLLDGDPANNNGGWQWAAGTGTDAQPYFRIFNPTTQGQKFDPEGAYVRRFLPALARVPARFIHTPHLLPPAEQVRADVQIGRDYPLPIVDHRVQRQRALTFFATKESS